MIFRVVDTWQTFILVLILSVILFSCSDSGIDYKITTKVNPNRIAPLTAELTITSEIPCRATVKVLGAQPLEQIITQSSDSLVVPVLGLYPNSENKVLVTLEHAGGQLTDTVSIKTNPLPRWFPTIKINTLDREAMEPGLHGCDMHFANNGVFRSMPFIFDDAGQVRWYLDLGFHGKMVSPFQRAQNGNILMVGRHSIYEINMLGKIVKQTQIDKNYGMHHDVLELPDGNLLACVGKRDAYIDLNGEQVLSDSDFIMHYDRKSEQITKEWDLGKNLDVDRADLNFFRPGDWLHMNGLVFDSKDGSIIVSAKNQGLIKLSSDDKLQWILSPKNNWGRSGRRGDGFDTNPFLLTAIDSNGNPYQSAIQNGMESASDFDFPWGPHAPKFLPNGNLLVFDNGTYRNFNHSNNYSRAVEYEIDESAMTVRQVWQYGKERAEDFFSSIVSDVDYLPETGNILITSGYLHPKTTHSGKIVEVDKSTNEEVFEATLFFKTLNGDKTVAGWGQTDILYRSQRMPLIN